MIMMMMKKTSFQFFTYLWCAHACSMLTHLLPLLFCLCAKMEKLFSTLWSPCAQQFDQVKEVEKTRHTLTLFMEHEHYPKTIYYGEAPRIISLIMMLTKKEKFICTQKYIKLVSSHWFRGREKKFLILIKKYISKEDKRQVSRVKLKDILLKGKIFFGATLRT